jgi:hypothetical protein
MIKSVQIYFVAYHFKLRTYNVKFLEGRHCFIVTQQQV